MCPFRRSINAYMTYAIRPLDSVSLDDCAPSAHILVATGLLLGSRVRKTVVVHRESHSFQSLSSCLAVLGHRLTVPVTGQQFTQVASAVSQSRTEGTYHSSAAQHHLGDPQGSDCHPLQSGSFFITDLEGILLLFCGLWAPSCCQRWLLGSH